ncbi:MAG: antirestriction protein ArdA [Flavobacteriia bacterium]|nr:antirestriction protein ArdA [Flavobacteriia bacterium]
MNDTIQDTEPKAWVGCLGCYNSGLLNGAWVDGVEAGDISKAVKIKIGEPAIYGENCPVCVKCGSDEFWVFDHEGYEGLISGECSPSEAQESAELLASADDSEREAFIAWLALGGDKDLEAMREAYWGEFNTYTELAEYFIDDLGSFNIPDNIRPYFDFEAYGRDLSYDFMSHGSHYFRSL